MPLTDITIRNAKPSNKPSKLFDGGGLFLLVTPSGGKWWRLKYRNGGKEKLLSLGNLPRNKPKRRQGKSGKKHAKKLLMGLIPAKQKKQPKERPP